METHYKQIRYKPKRFRGFRDLGAARALIGTIIATLGLLGCGAGVPPPAEADAALSERQEQAFVEALKPRRPGRPVVAVLALNEGTETTDFLLPHALLRPAGGQPAADMPCR